MIQVELGGWLTCRIWGGMQLLGTVWRIGRSPMEYSMEHSVSSAVVASEYSPPPMCELGRSGDRQQGCGGSLLGNIAPVCTLIAFMDMTIMINARQ